MVSYQSVDNAKVEASGIGTAGVEFLCNEQHDEDAAAATPTPRNSRASTLHRASMASVDDDEKELLSMLAAPATNTNLCCSFDWNSWLHILYLSLFSTVGVTLRAFMGRLFGGDCEAYSTGKVIDDWLWPYSHGVCITANGMTMQHGGALFVDLPANIFGSFVMGFFTGHPHSFEWPAVPCLPHDHPLQSDGGLHAGIRTAVCGCLTTFSSWNTQMVMMMEGSANSFYPGRHQVGAAMVGYLIGLQVAIVSFRAGRILAAWFILRTNPHLFRNSIEARRLSWRAHHDHLYWITPALVFVLFCTLIGLYVAGEVYWGIPYYRQLWIACLVAPAGTILRWKLSTLNGKLNIGDGTFSWFPVGTFLANLLGSVLSAALAARSIVDSRNGTGGKWAIPTLKAISLGVAGSLSTVSTFAKECVELGERNEPYDKKAFLYSHWTLVACCVVAYAVYAPIVNHGVGSS